MNRVHGEHARAPPAIRTAPRQRPHQRASGSSPRRRPNGPPPRIPALTAPGQVVVSYRSGEPHAAATQGRTVWAGRPAAGGGHAAILDPCCGTETDRPASTGGAGCDHA
jgi:hypothetical protein